MKISSRKRFLFLSLSILFCPFVAFALNVVDVNFAPQSATSSGSNGSVVSFSTGSAGTGTTSYWNENNDSNVIGNYFRGYYYDTQLGFFNLDWSSTDMTKNVHIVSSTDKCATGYGYRFAGYAQSPAAGLIQFDYSSDIFVYYCESDKKLHGYAYSKHTGFQSFEGISFEAVSLSNHIPLTSSGSDPFFVNNHTLILMGIPENPTNIQGETIGNSLGKEVIFYVVK